jgi:hypothetical protein
LIMPLASVSLGRAASATTADMGPPPPNSEGDLFRKIVDTSGLRLCANLKAKALGITAIEFSNLYNGKVRGYPNQEKYQIMCQRLAQQNPDTWSIYGESFQQKMLAHYESRARTASPKPHQRGNTDWREAAGMFIRKYAFNDVAVAQIANKCEEGSRLKDNAELWKQVIKGEAHIEAKVYIAAVREICKQYNINKSNLVELPAFERSQRLLKNLEKLAAAEPV